MTKVKNDINLDSSRKTEDKKDFTGRAEKVFHECALAVEKDEDLKKEMNKWEVAINDGLNEEQYLDDRIMDTHNDFSKKYKNALKKLSE